MRKEVLNFLRYAKKNKELNKIKEYKYYYSNKPSCKYDEFMEQEALIKGIVIPRVRVYGRKVSTIYKHVKVIKSTRGSFTAKIENEIISIPNINTLWTMGKTCCI